MEAVTSEDYGLDTMLSGAGDGVGRAATGERRLATPSEVASYLQVPVKTLYTWRYKRVGPRAHRVGRHLRYRWEDVEAWLASPAASR
jgi:excisionase family DNA binding protein